MLRLITSIPLAASVVEICFLPKYGAICYEGNHLILPGRDGIKREPAGLLECLVLAFDTNSREDGWFWIKFDTGALLVLSHF